MKKFLALALVLAMALSVAVIPTSADEGTNITGQSNMEVTAYAFGTAPNIDGEISEAEWGKSVVIADSTTANNDQSTAKSANNTYFQNAQGTEVNDNLKFELWLGWDATYFYLGTVIDDPSGYNVPAGRANIWNADCFQFRFDPMGPNSVQAVSEEGYDYKTTAFNVDKYGSPWAYPNDICNIGIADTGKTKTPVQVVDMGDAAGAVLLNDGRSVAAGYQSKVAVKSCGESAGKTTIEVAVPFAWLLKYVAASEDKFKSNEDGTFEGLGAGSVIGLTVGILDSTFGSDAYASILSWGSGMFGHQWDKTNEAKLWDNGGSNAVILSNLDAITKTEVEGLPSAGNDDVVPEHEERVIYSPMDDNSNYYQVGDSEYPTGDNYAVAMDACILDTNIQDESRSTIGWNFGSGYSMRGGYDCASQSFMFARNNWANGFDKENIVKQSAKFEWAKAADNENGGTWHNLAMKVNGNVATLYCDGVEVLTAEHPAFGTDGDYAEGSKLDFVPLTDEQIAEKKAEDPNYIGVPGNVIIFYISAEAYIDNCLLAEGDYNPATREGTIKIGFNYDTDDMVYKKSWARRNYNVAFPQVAYTCCAEGAEGYTAGHEWIITDATATEITHVCDVCGAEETIANDIGLEPFGGDEPAAALGDINGDGKWNAKDVAAFLQHSAGWSSATFIEENADYNQDGKVNMKDVSAMMTAIAKNEFGA